MVVARLYPIHVHTIAALVLRAAAVVAAAVAHQHPGPVAHGYRRSPVFL